MLPIIFRLLLAVVAVTVTQWTVRQFDWSFPVPFPRPVILLAAVAVAAAIWTAAGMQWESGFPAVILGIAIGLTEAFRPRR